jgi:phthalate 4,5-dioxygenase oxygenase subunit
VIIPLAGSGLPKKRARNALADSGADAVVARRRPCNGGKIGMLSHEHNEMLCRVGRGTPMGELMRQYWVPALPSTEFPTPDCPPKRMMLLGENLVMFRDSLGRIGALAEACPHRGASLYFGRNEECGLRCAYHGWKFDIHGNCLDLPSEEGIR